MTIGIFKNDCVNYLKKYRGGEFDLTFLDPPFNQAKEYRNHNDDMPVDEYWHWMTIVCQLVYERSATGASIYFMQREKNSQYVLKALESSGWTFQNLIIWKKKTSAVPIQYGFGKHYQIIEFATKGNKPRTFHKLRIDPPLLVTEKNTRPNGVYVTDVWDDIRELTSGYFAGDEPLRSSAGERAHKQQSPIHLLLRILLSSSNTGDLVFDPFAGTGTTLVVSKQLKRDCIGVELDVENVKLIKDRLSFVKRSDDIMKYYDHYKFTEDLNKYWDTSSSTRQLEFNSQMKDSPSAGRMIAEVRRKGKSARNTY